QCGEKSEGQHQRVWGFCRAYAHLFWLLKKQRRHGVAEPQLKRKTEEENKEPKLTRKRVSLQRHGTEKPTQKAKQLTAEARRTQRKSERQKNRSRKNWEQKYEVLSDFSASLSAKEGFRAPKLTERFA